MSLYAFLYDFNPRIVWPGLLVILVAIAAGAIVRVAPVKRDASYARLLTRCCLAVVFCAVATEFVLAGAYLFYPSYLDQVEPNIVGVSWIGWRGGPLYPPLDGSDIYGIPYGPNLYEIYGFFLWLLGPSIIASKVGGIVVFIGTQLLSFVVLRRGGATNLEAFAITAVQCFVESSFTDQAYVFGVRGDSLLFLIAQIAVVTATSNRGIWDAAALGILGAVAMNLKIHGALYILPVFAFRIGRLEGNGERLRACLIATAAGVIVLALPFLLANVALRDYYSYFHTITRAPLRRWLFEQNIVFATMFFVPLAWLFMVFAPKIPRGLGWFALASVACMAAVAVPASLDGAGPHHLLPFSPSMAWAYVLLRRAISSEPSGHLAADRLQTASAGLLCALVLGYSPLIGISWQRALTTYANTPIARTARSEIIRVLDDNPGLRVAVGPGSIGMFDASRLRVIPIFRGNPLPLDASAWMNFAYQGVSDTIVKAVLGKCRVDLWLMPHDEILSVTSLYTGQTLFSDAVRKVFQKTYERDGPHALFDRWRCKSPY